MTIEMRRDVRDRIKLLAERSHGRSRMSRTGSAFVLDVCQWSLSTTVPWATEGGIVPGSVKELSWMSDREGGLSDEGKLSIGDEVDARPSIRIWSLSSSSECPMEECCSGEDWFQDRTAVRRGPGGVGSRSGYSARRRERTDADPSERDGRSRVEASWRCIECMVPVLGLIYDSKR